MLLSLNGQHRLGLVCPNSLARYGFIRLLVDFLEAPAYIPSMALSARNRLRGKIEEIELGGVVAHVVVHVGSDTIESVITKRSVEDRLPIFRKGKTGASLKNWRLQEPGTKNCQLVSLISDHEPSLYSRIPHLRYLLTMFARFKSR